MRNCYHVHTNLPLVSQDEDGITLNCCITIIILVFQFLAQKFLVIVFILISHIHLVYGDTGLENNMQDIQYNFCAIILF